MKHWKVILSYCLGSVVWFAACCFIPASGDEMVILYLAFLYLTIGLAIGLFLRDIVYSKPWLLVFVPVLQLLLFIIGVP